MVQDHITILPGLGKGLTQLLHHPLGSRMTSGIDVQDLAATVLDGEKAVKQPECHRRYGEEIEGHDHLAMISQECEPALGWIAPPANTLKIPSHSSFRDVEAELPQLAVDLRSTPVQILFRHAANQSANLSGSLRPTARACTRTPSPVEPKSSSVPAHHGVRLNNDEGLGPP